MKHSALLIPAGSRGVTCVASGLLQASVRLQPVMICVVVSSSAAFAANWVELGPAPNNFEDSGRVSAIAVSHEDANRYYVAGAGGGVWRTGDGGVSWTPLTDHLPTCAIGALAVDSRNDQIIYAGSGEANYANHSLYGEGIYKSVNGGDTWEVLAPETFAGRTISRIVLRPSTSRVFAAVGYAGGFPARIAAKNHPQRNGPVGIFRSFDGGRSWSHLTQKDNLLPELPACDLIIHPADRSIMYAAIAEIFGHVDNGIYRTDDGGNSWHKLEFNLPGGELIGRISLAIAAASDAPGRGNNGETRMYALISRACGPNGESGGTLNFYRSDDHGQTWEGLLPASSSHLGMQASYGWYLSAVAIHPEDEDIAFFGGLELLRTMDGGESFDAVTPWHVDMHALAFDAEGRLLAGNDGGVHRSPNNGDLWESLNHGLGVTQFYPGISLHPADPNFVLGGTQDNGSNLRSGDSFNWLHVWGGDGGYTAIDVTRPRTLFVEAQGTGFLFRSRNGGKDFTWVGDTINFVGDRNCFIPPFTYTAPGSQTILYGTHRVWRSRNEGTTWEPISSDLTEGGPQSAIRGLVVAPSNPQTVYATTNDGRLAVSANGGESWTTGLRGIPGWRRVKREVAVDPLDDRVAYLAVGEFGRDQIRKTVNRGVTWTTIDGDFPDLPANTIAVHRAQAHSMLYVGTDRGVYATCDSGVHWRKFGKRLPHSAIMDLVVDTTFGRLVAATLGRGAWSIPLPGLADAENAPGGDLRDFALLQDCFSGADSDLFYGPPSESCQTYFDFDLDGDVDSSDFICHSARFEGPVR